MYGKKNTNQTSPETDEAVLAKISTKD